MDRKQIPLSQQIYLLMRALSETTVSPDKLPEVIGWVRDIPPGARPPELIRAVAQTFHLTDDEVRQRIEPAHHIKDSEVYVPREGWLRDYVEYTRSTEPPTAFHFFVGATIIGSALARNVRFPRGGAPAIYPNLCTILVAPSGKCRKTSAANLGVSLLRAVGGNVLADKTTPEAMVEAFKERSSSTGLIYAPELAVFLGKQKYQEGMIPMLTALFDCPKEWSSLTVMRGEGKIYNVALSMIGCSTMDWIQTAIPRDAFGGGFMSRLLFIVQDHTPRCFPLPAALNEDLEHRLIKRLLELTKLHGDYTLSVSATAWFDDWYRKRSDRNTENKQFAGYYERKPDHLMRLAIILAASQTDSLELSEVHLRQSLLVLDITESFLPSTFDAMSQTGVGEDHQRILQQLKKRGGAQDHSTLLRLNSNRMNSRQFKECIETLRMARLIEYDVTNRLYYLTPEGWK